MRAKRLLVLDDDPSVVDFLCESLVERGFLVETHTSPDKALARIAAEAFDLIITDVRMPGMSGTDVLTAILSCRPTQLVLLMTAFGSIDLATSSPSRSRLKRSCLPSSGRSASVRCGAKSFD
jgi:DNA-binding NtrC family response regulator